jgi:broad specificity phosphatase PhoE
VIDRLFVLRHAETRCAVERVLNGDPARPCPLTARGRDQAAEVGRRLAGVPLDLCITTEFERTQSTADVVLDGRPVARIVDPLLNDPPLGELEGLTIDVHSKWMAEHDWTDAPVGGGESQLDALRRYVTGWSGVVERSESSVLVIAHAFTISFIRTLESGDPPAVRRRYQHEVGLAELAEVDAHSLRAGLERAGAELTDLGYAPLDAGPQRD